MGICFRSYKICTKGKRVLNFLVKNVKIKIYLKIPSEKI